MSQLTIAFVIFLAVCFVVAIVGLVWGYRRTQRTKQLKSKFGPEYRRVEIGRAHV